MKIKGWKISIFILMMSICMCGLFSWSSSVDAYAANQTIMNCFYLLGDGEDAYQANTAVGTIEGTGDFVVGKTNVVLTARANKNFQLVGWNVVYNEQSNRTEFFDLSDVNEFGQKEISLAQKSGYEDVNADLEFVKQGNYYLSGTFTLEKVFEDITVIPVFDHIYYNVVADNVVVLSAYENSVNLGSDVLYYETYSENGGIITYSNAYINKGGNNYYYGNVYSESGEYYTLHLTLEETPKYEKVNYSCGAFRVGDVVEAAMNVNIDASSVANSKNIDFKGASIVSSAQTKKLDVYDDYSTKNFYSFEKDGLLRTTKYQINFEVLESENYLNEIKLSYHNLYVVDINLLVDGSPDHNEHSDILGNFSRFENSIESNLSIYNIYSVVNLNKSELSFLVKKATDNNARAFRVYSLKTISGLRDSVYHPYYTFKSINGNNNNDVYYSGISSNMEINVDYSSVKHSVDFKFAESLVDANLNPILVEMAIDAPNSIHLKRGATFLTGETAPADEEGVVGDCYLDVSTMTTYEKNSTGWIVVNNGEDIKYPGYKFEGFALNLTDTIKKKYSYTVNFDEPQGISVYLCLSKQEYEIALSNYNKVEIDGEKALLSVSVARIRSNNKISETLTSDGTPPTLVGTETVLQDIKVKLGDRLIISSRVNDGFIVRYSLLSVDEIAALVDSGITQEELDSYYISEFNFDTLFIESYLKTSKVIIYVYEEKVEYSLTYEIDVKGEDPDYYVMAQIDIAGYNDEKINNPNFEVIKYDLTNNVIGDGVSNVAISRIEIKGLYLKDTITLTSKSNSYGGTNYLYNWFVDGRATLEDEEVGDYHNHQETISKTRTIKVVYSIPVANINIVPSDDYKDIPDFEFTVVVEVDGQNVVADENGYYVVNVGKVANITIGGLGFGYNFIGYKINGSSTVYVSEFDFEHTTLSGPNNIELQFSRDIYNFYFKQYGAEFNGEYAQFNHGYDYAEMTVDSLSVLVTKPLGYFVSKAEIDETDLEVTLETNEYNRLFAKDILTYEFKILDRLAFEQIIKTYGKDENSDGVVEIYVSLYYTIYTYDISIKYTDSTGESHPDNGKIQYLPISLEIEFNGETTTILNEYPTSVVEFKETVPFNANVRIVINGQLRTGLMFNLWAYDDAVKTPIDQDNGKYLNIGRVVSNKQYLYMFDYDSYYIDLNYNATEGAPKISINGDRKASVTNVQISSFDKLLISAEPIRAKGYKFASITYEKVSYNAYVYNESTWSVDCTSLYYLDGHAYVQNMTGEYKENVKYFNRVVETVTYTENPQLLIEEFIIEQYVSNSKRITFQITYDFLQLTISGTTEEFYGDDEYSIAHPSLSAGNIMDFDINDILIVDVQKLVNKNDFVKINDGEFVVFDDIVRIDIQINKEAFDGVDGVTYDLTMGVKLYEVQINGVTVSQQFIENGRYRIQFQVGEFLPEVGEEITIKYLTKVQGKQLQVTTIVSDKYPNFYNNVQMVIASEFTQPVQSNSGYVNLDHELQFMSKLLEVYTNINDATYRKLFNISGVNIFLMEYNQYENSYDVAKDISSCYQEYGIDLAENSISGLTVTDYYVKISSLRYSFKIVFQIQPIVNYNAGPAFIKVFDCNNKGEGIEQGLTCGAGSKNDIQIADEIKSAMIISYDKNGEPLVGKPKNVGTYNVKVTFSAVGEYDWLAGIKLVGDISLTITPKPVVLTYDASKVKKVERDYNRNSKYTELSNIYGYLKIVDGKSLNISYVNSGFRLIETLAFISTSGKDGETFAANERVYYNLYIYNFKLSDTDFNRNFELKTEDLIIDSYIKINRKKIQLTNINVYDKVYDGNDKAELYGLEGIGLFGVLSGDEVVVNTINLDARFKDYSVGTDKIVSINSSKALIGRDAENYKLEDAMINNLTIFPYEVAVKVNGLGEVVLYNERGLTDKDLVGLIPLNSELTVEPIWADSHDYAKIYNKISKHIKGNTEFAVGYRLKLSVNGVEKDISKNLYLSIPRVKNLTGAYFFTDPQSGSVNYEVVEERIVIDLNNVNSNVSSIFLTKKKILLKPWQIVLIIISSVALVTAGVLTFIILRKRKLKIDSIHEKI